MYGIGGERRLTEFELDELPGYEGSQPVRVGNAASEQFQLDVYGEVAGVMSIGARGAGQDRAARCGRAGAPLVEHVETIWREPDDGIWEARGPQRHYTYSKVMAWVVFDRGGRARRAVRAGSAARALEGRSATRSTPRSASRATTRSAGPSRSTTARSELDASVLNIPLVGFLPGTDERVTGTIDAVAARARPRRLRVALLDRRDRRRPGRATRVSSSPARSGSSSALALNGRDRRGAHAVRAPARPRERPRPARRGVRRRTRAAGRQLPAGVQPPHADPRGARDLGGRG